MSLSFTTLTAKIEAVDLTMNVASATGFAVNTTTNTYVAKIGDEYLGITSINTLAIGIRRGLFGTRAEYHPSGQKVAVGLATDFVSGFVPEGPLGPDYSPHFSNLGFYESNRPTSQVTTAGAATYTAGQVLSGRILRDPNGSSRSDVLPTAALLVAALPGVQIDSCLRFVIQNDADAAETITLGSGSGGTDVSGQTLTIAQSNSKRFEIRFTGVAPGSEAYELRNLGTYTT